MATNELFEAEGASGLQHRLGVLELFTFAHYFFQKMSKDIKVVFILYTILNLYSRYTFELCYRYG